MARSRYPRRGPLRFALLVVIATSGLSFTEQNAIAQRGTLIPDSVQQLAGSGRPVRVVVGLDVPTVPEGRLDATGGPEQRRRIALAQGRLLSEIGLNARTVRRFEAIPFVAIEVDEPGLRELARLPYVRSIEEDAARKPLLTDSTQLVGVPTAAAGGYTGSGWAVAVIDSGVQSTHPFLSGKVIAEACYSTHQPSSGWYSLCPGSVTSSVSPGSGRECPGSIPGCDHGTHVAGIAAGNGGAMNGVAFNALLIAIQVGTYDAWNHSVTHFDSDILAGLQHVYALRTSHNIAAVNVSLGSGAYSFICDGANPSYKAMFDTLQSVGIAPVVASGNDGYADAVSAPACVSSAISVGATTKTDDVWTGTNSASILKLLAPGVSINSSVPGSTFGVMSGTSMAAPHVAGAWAILKQRYPGGTVAELLSILEQTGVGVYDPWNGLTKPRIDVGRAFASICRPAVSASALYHGAGQTVAAINVVVASGCAWSAFSNVPWISITSGGSATGAGRVELSIAPNAALGSRIGTLTIGGERVTVSQLGTGTPFPEASLLWQHEVTGNLVAWFLAGTTVSSAAVIGHVSDPRWRVVGSGHFNGDRERDLLWQHENGTVVVWLMQGTAHVQSHVLGTVSDAQWSVVGADDFTGDGKADLVWHHQSSGSIVVWVMDGVHYAGSVFVAAVSDLNWRLKGMADFDADGDPDLVWHHPLSGTVIAWLMDGTAYAQSVGVGTVSDVNWRVIGAADFDGDRHGDLLWQHQTTRSAVVWLLNSATYRTSVALETVSDPNWAIVTPK